MSGHLVVCHLNIRSLVSKLEELQIFLEKHSVAHVMGLSESWLDKSVTDSEIAVPGFRMHRMDRNRRGGGVLVYVSEDVRSVRRQDLEEDGIEAVWIEARVKKTHVLLCNLYRPPDARAAWFDGLWFMLEREIASDDLRRL